jgi:lipopolysaccharide transport system ATP-binding protein
LYNNLIALKTEQDLLEHKQEMRKRIGNGRIQIKDVRMRTSRGYATQAFTGEQVQLEITFKANEDVEDPTLGISIRNRSGIEIYGTNNYVHRRSLGQVQAGRSYVIEYNLSLDLGPQDYTVAVAAHPLNNHVIDCYDWVNDAFTFRVLPSEQHRFRGSCRLDTQADCVLIGG